MNKNKTIGELIDEARKKSGEPVLAGHDIMALERFGETTRHMIAFDVLSHASPVGNKGERMYNCPEVRVLKGEAENIRNLANRLLSTRGVKHGAFSLTTTGKDLVLWKMFNAAQNKSP